MVALVGTLLIPAVSEGASANPYKPDPPGYPFTGTKRYVSLLCRFGDVPTTPHDSDYYRTLMGGTYPGMSHYWDEVSFGRLQLDGSDVFGWYHLPQPRGYYFHEDGRTNGDKIRDDCTAAADADVYFPHYDGIIFWMNAELSHRGHGGRLVLDRDGVEQNYGRVIMADQEDPVGVLAHEIGHGLDWSAHSSTGPCCDGDSSWDVMGAISFSCHTSWLECLPVHPTAYRKLTAGWIAPERVFTAGPLESRTTMVAPLTGEQASGHLIAIVPVRGSSTRFYTVEVRRRSGYDEGLLREGVLIHYVDSVKDHVWLQLKAGDTSDAGSGNWLEGDRFDDPDAGISISIGQGDPATGYEVTITTPAWSVPVNDDPDGAIDVSEPTFAHGIDTDLATISSAEPVVTCTGDRPTNSVWYRFTPGSDGWFDVTTRGSDYPAVLALFTRDVTGFRQVLCGFDYGWDDSPAGADGFNDVVVRKGTTYYLEVASLGFENGGRLRLSTGFLPGTVPGPSDPSEPDPADPGDPDPNDPGTSEPVEHLRAITLRLKNHLIARGRVGVSDGHAACIQGVAVKIQRRVEGSWRTSWTTTTNDSGSFGTPILDKQGRYRAVAVPLRDGLDRCLRAVSYRRVHRH